jgi:hypothetical protein
LYRNDFWHFGSWRCTPGAMPLQRAEGLRNVERMRCERGVQRSCVIPEAFQARSPEPFSKSGRARQHIHSND